jgi:hypothetical protein
MTITPLVYLEDFVQNKLFGILKFIGTCVLAMIAYEIFIVQKLHERVYYSFFTEPEEGSDDIAVVERLQYE